MSSISFSIYNLIISGESGRACSGPYKREKKRSVPGGDRIDCTDDNAAEKKHRLAALDRFVIGRLAASHAGNSDRLPGQ